MGNRFGRRESRAAVGPLILSGRKGRRVPGRPLGASRGTSAWCSRICRANTGEEAECRSRGRQRDRAPEARCFRANSGHGTVGGVIRVEDQFRGREQFAVGMKCSDCRRSLLRGQGLTDKQPREGESYGGHRCANSVGAGAFELGCRGVGGLCCGSERNRLAGCWFVMIAIHISTCDLREGLDGRPSRQSC